MKLSVNWVTAGMLVLGCTALGLGHLINRNTHPTATPILPEPRSYSAAVLEYQHKPAGPSRTSAPPIRSQTESRVVYTPSTSDAAGIVCMNGPRLSERERTLTANAQAAALVAWKEDSNVPGAFGSEAW